MIKRPSSERPLWLRIYDFATSQSQRMLRGKPRYHGGGVGLYKFLESLLCFVIGIFKMMGFFYDVIIAPFDTGYSFFKGVFALFNIYSLAYTFTTFLELALFAGKVLDQNKKSLLGTPPAYSGQFDPVPIKSQIHLGDLPVTTTKENTPFCNLTLVPWVQARN